LARDGLNVLPVAPGTPAWRQLVGEFFHFFALMLWVAAALAFVAGLPQLGVAIIVVILVNGLFAFAQQHRAEHAAERLRDLLPRRATVRRDGRPVEIDAAELVVGDLVLLEPGDRVSADLRVLEAHECRVDSSALTGESVPLATARDEILHAGTFVVEGEAAAEVVATGQGTRLAGIAQLTRATARHPTPLAHELERLVRTIAAIALGVGVSFFALALLIGTPASDGFVFAIGVTVALVPEGLLPTVRSRSRSVRNGWRTARRSSAAWRRWKRWAPPRSSAPTRQARSPKTGWPSFASGRPRARSPSAATATSPRPRSTGPLRPESSSPAPRSPRCAVRAGARS
jgi:magnesium-transporting ATPase (P-type)